MSELLQLENSCDRPELLIMANALGKALYESSLKDNEMSKLRTDLFNERTDNFQTNNKNVELEKENNELQKENGELKKKNNELQKKKEEEEEEITAETFIHAGIHYLKDENHIIYDKDTYDVIGKYNERTNTIVKFLEYTSAPLTLREINLLKENKALKTELQKKNENDYASKKKSTREATLSRYSTQQFYGCSTVSITIDGNNQIDEYNNVPFLQETFRKMLKKNINDNDEIKNNEIECKEYLKNIFIITKIEYTEENITNFKKGTGYTYFEYGLSVRFNSGKIMIKILIRLIEFLELKMQLQIKLKTGEILDIVV